MLSTAEAHALRAELTRLRGVVRIVGVGADFQAAESIGPRHDAGKFAANGRVNSGNRAVVYIAGGAVERQPVALLISFTGQLEFFILFVHFNRAATGDTATTHAAGDDSGVRSHTAANGQNAFGGLHALNIFGGSLKAD